MWASQRLVSNLPRISVGVRFHDIRQINLLERCLNGIAAQTDVKIDLILALQGFTAPAARMVHDLVAQCFEETGFDFKILNVQNPRKRDLRSRLLNKIVDVHYDAKRSEYLSLIDFDDIWFNCALKTLLEPLQLGNYVLSYADIHCADIYFDSGQCYVRGIKDLYQIGNKTKRDFLRGNFLPLHSYMFHTGRIDRKLLQYDEALDRLEDYDVLLSVARSNAISGLHRRRLIGLYNFYTVKNGSLNTTANVFAPLNSSGQDARWIEATRNIISRHAGQPWQEFWGEEWVL